MLCRFILLSALLSAACAFAQTKSEVSSNELGYRLGQIDAKIEGISSKVDSLSTAQAKSNDEIHAANIRLANIDSRLDRLEKILFGILGLFGASIVGWIVTRLTGPDGWLGGGTDRRHHDGQQGGGTRISPTEELANLETLRLVKVLRRIAESERGVESGRME